MRALAIAATGMNAQQMNLEVIANNIANLNTTGFKGARAEFTDLLYQAERQQGVPNQAGQEPVPEGAMLGLGVRTAAIRNLHRQGPLANTANQLDMAINGRGYFQITNPNGEINYTRAGSFNRNNTGQLVTLEGYTVEPAITIPANAVDVVINGSGQVFAKIDGQVQAQNIGQLSLANFANESGLEPLGNGLYRETAASGAAVVGVAGDLSFGKIQQGYLESSNVDPVKEITNMITAQRAFEMNSKVIQAADEMAGTVSKGIR
ncbi:flagellar basal-body rod protein FlgG [Methylobacterium sp. Leaf469]|jgi:flagellar basal-body rod protein FlgG|uniref:flagellar basal-body rod protein FlgG n=1 Tax=unclassified Methylobacterium TaxID=2615210 RepID=UPI0006FF190E|nr:MULTISPECIES: flagellar basal-body rod protein FlgG [unclassified Methylobacterium]USU33512.1 flagellar basal-body rod protein FlgG [Methylobacterium sp. OTU13CASTA1]KQO69555.1 flagellar basal-body rod protein FlgG [Methylobacterium sp. Leaf87]KQP34412.1 flagellar basal-body rod protein FlgG [Methylobacterium sp. Leaf102]KQP36808.1 flagellar basal-body rod protein FlgG [Methylobacterium sp. Leaf100]KQP72231.1 flagellar basal-body rod protein FlgG [Methylobacterium sp. Leaf112]